MIKLYKTNSQQNVVSKELTNETELQSAKIRLSELDVINPTVLCLTSSLVRDYFNYVYISELNRYYFITSATRIDNTHAELALHCDLLYTYAEKVLNASGTIIRSNSSPYYSNFETECRKTFEVKTFENTPFSSTGEYILTTITNNEVV